MEKSPKWKRFPSSESGKKRSDGAIGGGFSLAFAQDVTIFYSVSVEKASKNNKNCGVLLSVVNLQVLIFQKTPLGAVSKNGFE